MPPGEMGVDFETERVVCAATTCKRQSETVKKRIFIAECTEFVGSSIWASRLKRPGYTDSIVPNAALCSKAPQNFGTSLLLAVELWLFPRLDQGGDELCSDTTGTFGFVPEMS